MPHSTSESGRRASVPRSTRLQHVQGDRGESPPPASEIDAGRLAVYLVLSEIDDCATTIADMSEKRGDYQLVLDSEDHAREIDAINRLTELIEKLRWQLPTDFE